MTNRDWQPLTEELRRWKDAGRTPLFWLRDDDAVEPTPALDRLLDLTARYNIPATLAVIPAHATQALADRLSSQLHVTVAVHGWAHQNHAAEGRKKQELGLHRPRDIIVAELQRGLTTLTQLFGKQAAPVLVPPWNRIDFELLRDLPGLGFQALSAYGSPLKAPLATINSNVDIIDWHGTRGCHPTAFLVDGIVTQLADGFEGGGPVGLLTHHLVHDEAAWQFLEQLLAVSKDAGAKWLAIGDLLEATTPAT